MSFMKVKWTLLLVYYCHKAPRLKINAKATLIVEGINSFTLWHLLHDFIDYIIANVLLHPSEYRSAMKNRLIYCLLACPRYL